MKSLLFLSALLMVAGCATDPNPATPSSQASADKAALLPGYDRVKVGMSRQEAEQILGEPASVTETASGATCVWVYGQRAASASPQNTANDSQTISQIGNIAATAAGIFIPYVGLATNIGSQVYSLSNPSANNAKQSAPRAKDNTLVVTIEFRDNQVYSIQRAHPVAATLPK